MEPTIDLAPGAEDNPLAVRLSEAVKSRLSESPRTLRDFRALRGSVLMVAQDVGDSVTLRFDHGRLTIHDGAIGIPSVTFCADRQVLERLQDVPMTRWGRLPLGVVGNPAGRQTLRELTTVYARGELKIYGLLAHPRLILRFLRILATRP
jgi:hypothetical protein